MKHKALSILEDLIRIKSVNPYYDHSSEGEGLVAEYIESYFDKIGLDVIRQSVLPGRDNVIVKLNTGNPNSVLLFESHMDTVSSGNMEDAFIPKYLGNRLYGRGACDTKGSLAAMIYAIEECAKQPEKLNSDIIFCASVDEEYAFRGLTKFLELDLPISAAVVGEPTEMKIIVSHKGCVRFAVNTFGKSAHSSVPHQGENAIVQMSKVIEYINSTIEPNLSKKIDMLCGPATISIGVIQGGENINIVPDYCSIKVDRRIIPGENPNIVLNSIKTEFENAFSKLDISHSIDELLLDWALDTDPNDKLVKNAIKTAKQLDLTNGIFGETYGSNASKLQGIKGIPSIVYGPGSIVQAHSNKEWVSTKDVEQASQFYYQLAKNYSK